MRKLFVSSTLISFGISLDQDFVIKIPPRSLNRYYPPRSKTREYLSKMHSMSTSIHGIQVNISKGNWESTLAWAKNLERLHKESANMVPEWKNYYKIQAVEEMVKASASKDTNKVIQSLKSLGESCNKCHADNQAIVKVYYHFSRYDNIRIEDPMDFLEDSDFANAQRQNKEIIMKHVSKVDQYCYRFHNVHLVPNQIQKKLDTSLR